MCIMGGENLQQGIFQNLALHCVFALNCSEPTCFSLPICEQINLQAPGRCLQLCDFTS